VAEVSRRIVVGRGDDIPRRAAGRDVVQRGELAGNVVGLGEAGRDRAAQPDMCRRPGQAGEQGHRFQHVHEHREAAPGVQVVGARGWRVGDEEEVEAALLRELRQRAEIGDVGRAGCVRLGMQPGSRMAAGGLADQQAEGKLHFTVHARSTPFNAMLAWPEPYGRGLAIHPELSAEPGRCRVIRDKESCSFGTAGVPPAHDHAHVIIMSGRDARGPEDMTRLAGLSARRCARRSQRGARRRPSRCPENRPCRAACRRPDRAGKRRRRQGGRIAPAGCRPGRRAAGRG